MESRTKADYLSLKMAVGSDSIKIHYLKGIRFDCVIAGRETGKGQLL